MPERTLPAGVVRFVHEETSDHGGGTDERDNPATRLEGLQRGLEVIGDDRHALGRSPLGRGLG
jgi:hypothetical protein